MISGKVASLAQGHIGKQIFTLALNHKLKVHMTYKSLEYGHEENCHHKRKNIQYKLHTGPGFKPQKFMQWEEDEEQEQQEQEQEDLFYYPTSYINV